METHHQILRDVKILGTPDTDTDGIAPQLIPDPEHFLLAPVAPLDGPIAVDCPDILDKCR